MLELTERIHRAQALHCVVHAWPQAVAESNGPLHGVALAHKDIFDLPGRAPGLGVDSGRPDPTRRRAAALEQLAKAGALQWGALAMAPHACGATGQNPHFARVINPIDPNAAIGGSSSGCAAAVAAGLSAFSLGTDTAGSVRIPAATCGLLGLKTTHGLIDTAGCAPLAPSLDSIGVLAREVSALQAALAVLAPDLAPADAAAPARLCAWVPATGLGAAAAQALQSWCHAHQAQSLDLADTVAELSVHAQRVLCHEVAQTHRAALLDGSADPAVEALGWMGLAMPQAWYEESLALRGSWTARVVAQVFAQADVLVLPALPHGVPDWSVVHVGEPRFDARQLLALHHFMGFINYLGLPALHVPIARDAQGRPLGVQLVGRPFAEHRLLALAAQQPSFFSDNP